VAVEKQLSITYSECVCASGGLVIHMQSACAVLYCHVWPLRLYSIFPHYYINGKIFGEKVCNRKMCVLIFSTTFVWNISHSKKNSTIYDHKCTLFFMQGTRCSRHILMKLEFSRQIFEKYSNIQFHENLPSRIFFHMDRQNSLDEANSRFTQFCQCS